MMDLSDKKRYGKFYTPEIYTEFLSKLVLKVYHGTKKNLKLLDPSCGDGAFLDEMTKRIPQLIKKLELTKVDLYGIDIDDKALELASIRIKNKNKVNFNITLLNADLLLGDTEIYQNTKKYLNKLFKDKFDIIIGNPPWVSLKGKFREKLYSNKQLQLLLERYPCDKYRPNTSEMFIWKSLEILNENGLIGFIVPDRIFKNSQFSKLRELIFYKYKLEYVVSNVKFQNVNSDNVIFVLRKKISKPDDKIKFKSFGERKWEIIPKNIFFDDNYNCFFLKKDYYKVIEKIKRTTYLVKLKELFITGVGFIGKKNKFNDDKVSLNSVKVILGRNIERNTIKSFRYFDFINENILGGTNDISKLTTKPKIVLRKTGKILISAIDKKGYLPEQSLYFILSKSNNNLDLYLLNRLLNSNILNFYYLLMAVSNINSIPQIKKKDLDNFPIISYEQFSKIYPRHLKNTEFKKNPFNYFKNISEKLIYSLYGLDSDDIYVIEEYLEQF